jgi:predicted alpha/beta-hydrolase family hydrolase
VETLLILAHGAGAGQKHPFMRAFAEGLTARGVETVTFNFSYIEEGRRVPDRNHALEARWREVIEATRSSLRGRALAIGGKSMGGRIASQVAAQGVGLRALRALVFLGYPLHPPNKPAQLRAKHLPRIGLPMLFVQGERDVFGTPDELRPILAPLAPPPELHVIAGGDHSFAVAKRAGRAQSEIYAEAMDAIVRFLLHRSS